jgi:hypothetical protein
MIPPNSRGAPIATRRCPQADERLIELVYELLDAHWETSRIASDWDLDEAWQAHLMYLLDLQRVARELLAFAGQPVGAEASRGFSA